MVIYNINKRGNWVRVKWDFSVFCLPLLNTSKIIFLNEKYGVDSAEI